MSLRDLTVRPVAVLGGVRTPFCRVGTNYADVDVQELLRGALSATVRRFNLVGKQLGDVALGTVIWPPSTWNLAREAVLASGLAPETPAMGLQRACGTGLDATMVIASKIALGTIDSGIAGGADSASDVSLFLRPGLSRAFVKMSRAKTMGERLAAWKGIGLADLKPGYPGVVEATTGLSMGQHCEKMAKEWKISRADQDQIAFESHQKAAAALKRGFYEGLIEPFAGATKDNVVRGDTSLEKLAKLKPAFDRGPEGTLTAGNSSALTDGGACVLLSSDEWAKANGHERLAYITDFENAAIDLNKEGLLMAPVYAVARMLKRNNLKLQDFDFYEIHEAFAAQLLCTLRAWESESYCKERLGLPGALGSIDRNKLNVAGGSTAMGHPFAATGARIVAGLGKLLKEKGSGRGLISICTGGGMGSVAIVERP